ncbi:MAG: hypothetical protein KKH97_08050 [Proteobacteria bacterium]|nr:hypothetical protein [Pseudomonadota bacterium]MBU1712840.1 hypothetical protein [Pseudomonadota bacterium]
MKSKLTVYYICIISLLFSFTAYSEETRGNSRFQYAELVVVHRFYGEADGIAQMSTTVYFNDGSEKDLSAYRKESIISYKDAKNEAFKDLIEKYKNKKMPNLKASEIYLLNMLGMEGWEIISYDDKPLNFAEGSGSKLRYLMKKEISIK